MRISSSLNRYSTVFGCWFVLQTAQYMSRSVEQLSRDVHVCRYAGWQHFVTRACARYENSLAKCYHKYVISAKASHVCCNRPGRVMRVFPLGRKWNMDERCDVFIGQVLRTANDKRYWRAYRWPFLRRYWRKAAPTLFEVRRICTLFLSYDSSYY